MEQGAGNREQGTGTAKLWLVFAAVAVALVAIAVWWIVAKSGEGESASLQLERHIPSHIVDAASAGERTATAGGIVPNAPQSQDDETSSGDDSESESESEEEPQTEEEKREAEEEKLVDAFDDLTDKWQEPSAKGVTMADVDNFAKSFRRIPKARQDECIHRALNLIPDENVMLLAGVLMDKTMDKEIVETVYNDVLNRDEDVKKPILQEIFKDKTHPCWADTAWILDVTGELPKAK